jgi:hypothetical protein
MSGWQTWDQTYTHKVCLQETRILCREGEFVSRDQN